MKKRKSEGTGTDPGGERADRTSLLPHPEPHVVVGGSNNSEGDIANAAGERVSSTSQLPQPDGPKSVPARGKDGGQEGGEAYIDGGEVSQRNSHLHPDAEVVVGSGSSGELEGVYPSPSTPLISLGGKLDSA